MTQIKVSDFREAHLAQGGVWTWSSDLHDSEDFLVEVPLTEAALSEVDSLIIRAKFKAANGANLRGIVVYEMAHGDVFSIEILDGMFRFTLNKFAPDLSRDELNGLADHLSSKVDELLPITYEIDVDELQIPSGEFVF